MRQETNNEMDLLLRRLGRRQEQSASTDHLDADELSSYAENVLPPPARVRYTEHLAECARCRELVVQLSSSAGVVAAQETAKVSTPSALRKFLASLFSPMVLRYAVPALGLVVVAAIGFIVSRQQQRRADSVAQITQQDRAQASGSVSESQPSSSSARPFHSPETPAPNKTVPQNNAEPVVAPPPPNAPPTVSSINAEVQPDTATKELKDQQAKTKDEPAAAPKPAAATDELKKVAPEVQKQKAEERVAVANEPPPAEKAAEESKREDRKSEDTPAARSRPARREAQPLGVGSVQSAGRAVQRDDVSEKDKNDADARTVTVAGRRFRKQGSVWIDTAYDSSRGAMNITRGSEQYRVLVADEPAIKSIADQLDGEIIVVWKGRNYRIR